MDAGASVPCSAGVMYEYLFGRNRATHHAGRRRVLRARVFLRQ
jgi:hypothetical protein